MQKQIIALAVAAGMAAACSQPAGLTPAPGAQPAPSMPGGATSTTAGVTLGAWPQEWDAEPVNLATEVTPVLVRIENKGTTPISLRFAQFVLRNPSGQDFAALPPFNIDETVREPVTATAAYPFSGFYVAPYLRGYYPYLDPFVDPFELDRLYYDSRFTAWQTLNLPTADMVRLALPEGVVEPGGSAMGFVYFEDVSDDPMQVTLVLHLLTPRGEDVGTVEIPFYTSHVSGLTSHVSLP